MNVGVAGVTQWYIFFTKLVSISIYLFDCLGVAMIICHFVSGMKVVLEKVLV